MRHAIYPQFISRVVQAANFSGLLGFVAWKLGRSDEAAAHYSSDIELMRTARYRPSLAASCFEFSQLLFERGTANDKKESKALQDEALAIARELGMKPLTERILRQREFLKA